MPLISDPPAAGVKEQLILDPAEVSGARAELNLHDGPIQVRQEGVDWGDFEIAYYMSERAYGEIPVDSRMPNRKVTIPLYTLRHGGADYHQARLDLQSKVARIQQEGGRLKRELANGYKLYLDIVGATLKYGGSSAQAIHEIDPDVQLVLDTQPDWYGDAIELDTVSGEGYLTAVFDEILGDYPGRVQVQIDELSGAAQRGLLWAFRCRHYSDDAATAGIVYEAADLEPLDAATLTGGAVEHANLTAGWTPIAATGDLTHTGTYRVWAQADASVESVALRFAHDVGEYTWPTENTPWSFPGLGGFYLADLGEVRLDPPPLGDHRWMGQVQARGVAGGESVSIKRLLFVPVAESCGRVSAPIMVSVGSADFIARDEFQQTAGALTGKTAPVGGAWAGVGDADDFTVDASDDWVERATDSDGSAIFGRFAISGVSALAGQVVQVDFLHEDFDGSAPGSAVIARYADIDNWVYALVNPTAYPDRAGADLYVTKRVGGVVTNLFVTLDQTPQFTVPWTKKVWHTLRIQVEADGGWAVWYGPTTHPTLRAAGQDSDLAAGGDLEIGKPGVGDFNAGSVSIDRRYDNFKVWAPTDDAALFANTRALLSTEGIYRQDPTGTVYSPATAQGDLPRIPNSGYEARPVEFFAKWSRGDLDRLPDTADDDEAQVTVTYRPCWLFVPGT